jgi:hypothetical protein
LAPSPSTLQKVLNTAAKLFLHGQGDALQGLKVFDLAIENILAGFNWREALWKMMEELLHCALDIPRSSGRKYFSH